MELQYKPLTKENIENFIGKKIEFSAEGFGGYYRGIALIKSVDFSKRFPIECECLSGDDLSYAFLDDHGLISNDGGTTYSLTKTNKCFSYSDSYREIFIRLCE